MKTWASLFGQLFAIIWLCSSFALAQDKSNYDQEVMELESQILSKAVCSDPVLLAKVYNSLAKLHFKQRNYSLSKQAFNKELQLLITVSNNSTELMEQKAKAYYNVANHFRLFNEYASAMEAAQKALYWMKKIYGEQDLEVLDVYKQMADIAFLWKKLDIAQEYCEQAILIFKQLDKPVLNSKYIELLILKAAILVEEGNFEMGNNALNKALNLYHSSTDSVNNVLIRLYNNLGGLREREGKAHEALNYFQKALHFKLQLADEKSLSTALLFDNIAVAYINLKQHREAIPFLLKSKAIYQELLSEQHASFALVITHLGACYQVLGCPWEAEQLYQQALRIYRKTEGKNALEQSVLLQKMALNTSTNNAYNLYKEAAEICFQNYGKVHPSLAVCYFNWAKLLEDEENNQQASKMYQAALEANMLHKEGQVLVLDKLLFFQSATALLRLSTQLKQYGLAEEIYKLAKGQLSPWVAALKEGEDLNRIQMTLHEFMELSITLYYELWSLNPKQLYWEEALLLTDYSKSLYLLRQLNLEFVFNNAQIPNEWISLYKLLKTKRLYFEKQWVSAQYEAILASEKEYLRKKMEYYGDALSNLELKIEQNYKVVLPYKKLNFANNKVFELFFKEQEQQLFLIYFAAKEGLFLLAKRGAQYSFKLIDKNIYSDIESYLKELQDIEGLYQNFESSLKNYQYWAAILGKELFPSPILASEWSQITIIPDEFVSKIPFEALLYPEEKQPVKSNFFELNYWLKHASFRYAYSIQVLLLQYKMEAEKEVEGVSKVLAIAPTYHKKRTNEHELDGARKELEILKKRFKGRFLIEKLVDKEQFFKLLPNCNLLHLAMHASANNQEEPYLLLSDSGQDSLSDRVYLNSIVEKNLPQLRFVILSACQTESGAFQKGEGQLTIGRAFAMAGVPSMLSTLWSLNDQSARELMPLFYDFLDKGHNKDKALQLAKLEYLNKSSSLLAHPIFWAAIIQWGTNHPIELEAQAGFFDNWVYLCVTFLLAIIILLAFGSKNIKKKNHATNLR